MNAPKTIYLQIYGPKWEDADEVTWCKDMISEDDIEYVRRDIAEESIGRLLAALKDLMESPYDIESATVPKAGIEANPAQVVGVMHVGILKVRAAQAAIAEAKKQLCP